MYQCQSCKKEIKICPACKYRIKDSQASLLNQIAGTLVFLTIIFVSLEIKVTEETEIAMKPFRQAREETERKEKVKEASLPKPAKDSAANQKKSNKSGGNSRLSKEGDFRAGTWGMLKSQILTEEKAQPLHVRQDPYNLDFLTKIGNYEVIARYMFAQNRLSGGCYILIGQPVEITPEVKERNGIKVGEPIPSWVKVDFSYYREATSNLNLNSFESADQFFYEMYISMASQMGRPNSTALDELENEISRQEKVESVIAHNRILTYSWETNRSKVNFYFAGLDSTPYFRLEFLSDKNLKPDKL